MSLKTALVWIFVLSVIFLMPLIVPAAAFLLLSPFGFWQMLVFLVVGTILYIAFVVLLLFMLYIFL